MFDQIIDANINRASEGLRVIEEYVRFVSKDKAQTLFLSEMRKKINLTETSKAAHLMSRNSEGDMRAKEVPQKRRSHCEVLIANFKRAEEALRVLEEYTGDPVYNVCRYDLYDCEKAILLTAMKPRIQPGIYLVSDEVSVLKKGLDWGVSLVQYRDKFADKATRLQKAKQIKVMSEKYTTPFIVNDDLDIALLVDADGFHSGQDDLGVGEQRRLLGPHKLIGKTTHNLNQGIEAQIQGADYVSVGPVFKTPSKPDREAIGFEYLAQAASNLTIPYVVIGGIAMETVEQILPYSPPLIGLIRDYENIPALQKRCFEGRFF